MDLHFFVSTGALLIMGGATIIFSIKEEKTKKEILKREKVQRQRLYEISILKEVQDRIGYSLDIEKIVDVITGSLKNLLPFSSTTSVIIKEDKILLKTYIEDKVNHKYLNQVKKNTFASLSALLEKPAERVDESLSGIVLDEENDSLPSSFFNIPLFVGHKVVAMINVSSVKTNMYKEEEMTILYKIANQATSALNHLQEVLNTEKGKLMAMIGSLADGVFMVDSGNQLLLINDAAKRMLGIQKEQVSIFDIISSFSDKYDIAAKIQQAISQKKEIGENEIQIGQYCLKLIVTPVVRLIHQEKDYVIGVSVLLHDITLEKSLARVKEDFTNMMVHELRAPLTAIKNSSSLMLQDGNLDTSEKEKFLGIIHDQSKILLNYVSSLLDAAKIESGKLAIEKTSNDIEKILQQAYDVFLPQAKMKNIGLFISLEGQLPRVFCDSLRIEQVLNNLLSNSLKYTPEGGKITVKAEKEEHNIVKVSVADTGIGIPKEKQASLFSKFSQVIINEETEKKTISGTGLGLYITKGIIEAHGGKVALDSDVEKGTTISFTLPVYEGKEEIKPEEHHDEPPRSFVFGTPLN